MDVVIVGIIGIVFIFLLGFLNRKINKGETKRPFIQETKVGYDISKYGVSSEAPYCYSDNND